MDHSVSTFYLNKLEQALLASDYDAVLVAPSEELRFFTGFSPMMCERFQGFFLTRKRERFYFCNLLYAEEMREAYGEDIPVYSWFDGDSMTAELRKVLSKYGLLGGRILVNQSVQAFQLLDIEDEMEVSFSSGKRFLEEVRIRKTPEEMENLRVAARIADRAFEEACNFIRPGVSEGQIRDYLAEKMQEFGGEGGGGLVASGPNAGFPHYCGDKRIIQEQDHMILDYGCQVHGMNSDMSRTVFVGSIDEKIGEIYDIVNRSQLAGQAAAKKGAFVPEVDRAARQVIEEAGYGAYFPYRLGHGIGYSVHEGPYIHGNNPMQLDAGMAFSVEPGIYLPGKGGVRIENIILINDKGETEVLNQASREKILCV